ncbi:MAG: hypothetical protein ACI9QL_002312 [Candidatus Omnitrophota bacterium]|jgi:hypothetical protein
MRSYDKKGGRIRSYDRKTLSQVADRPSATLGTKSTWRARCPRSQGERRENPVQKTG